MNLWLNKIIFGVLSFALNKPPLTIVIKYRIARAMLIDNCRPVSPVLLLKLIIAIAAIITAASEINLFAFITTGL